MGMLDGKVAIVSGAARSSAAAARLSSVLCVPSAVSARYGATSPDGSNGVRDKHTYNVRALAACANGVRLGQPLGVPAQKLVAGHDEWHAEVKRYSEKPPYWRHGTSCFNAGLR